MMRIGLLLATNFAVLMVAGLVMSLLGLDNSSTMGLLLFCGLFGFGGSFVSLLMSKNLAKRSSNTRLIETPTSPTETWLVDTVSELAQKAEIGMPEVGIFPSHQPNAFATGWNKNKSLVAVSVGLLNNFKQDEVRAVLAHEIGHVANGDMVTLTLIQGVTNTFVLFLSRIVAQAVSGASNNRAASTAGYYLTMMVTQALFGVLATIIVMWFSRRREFRADEAGAKYASLGSMVGALERLKQPVPHSSQEELPENMAAFGISPASLRSKLGGLMATHPSLDVRIAALRELG